MFKSPILYISASIIIFLGSLSSIFYLKNKTLESENRKLIERVSRQDSLIQLSNQVIEKNKLEIEEYKNKKPIIQEKIVTRYKTVKVDTKTKSCESELESVKELLDIFDGER